MRWINIKKTSYTNYFVMIGAIVSITTLFIPFGNALAENWQFLDGSQQSKMTFRWLDKETLQQYRVCDSSDLPDGCSPGQIKYGEVYRLTLAGAGGEQIFSIDAAASQQTGDNAACDAFNKITILPGGSPKSANFSNNGVTTDGTSTCPNTEHIVYSEEAIAIYDDYDVGYSLSPKNMGLAVNTAYLAKDNERMNSIIAANVASTQEEAVNEAGEATCGDVGGVFGWMICEAASIVDDFAGFLEAELKDLLKMPELAPGSEVYTAWSSIRTLATSVLVLVALFAIAAQIFNLDFVSAYTMRKIIPRIIIATILLYTSYFLAGLMIMFVNALGDGVAAIIMGPFDGLLEASNSGSAIQFILAEAGITGGQAAGSIGILVGAGAVAFVGAAGIGGIIIAVALVAGAILVAFVTLVLRKVFILGLVMVMPLAIVAWILPNTQKWATSWWNMFSKLLFMYPLVIGLLAVGRVAAYLIAKSGDIATNSASIHWYYAALPSVQGSLVLIMILIAYFGPYYFIPSMFKATGGMFAKINSSMDGFGKKYGRKAGDAGGKFIGDKAASKYKAGADGKVQKYGWNAAARLATGNVVPGVKRQQKVAARASAYHKERNEQADFLAENTYASLGYGKGGDWLAEEAKKEGAQGDAALRMIAETKRFDLLDRVGGERVRQYADENRGFGAAVASQRRDLLDPGKVKIWAAKDAVGQHDSFFGSVDKDTGVYTPGSYMDTLSDATVEQIRSDKDLYNALGTAGKHYIDNFHGGPNFTGAPGTTPGSVTTPSPTTPSGAPVGTVAPVNTADLQNALRSATGGTGNVTAASDGQLRALYAATAKSQDPVVQQTHIDLQREVVRRGNTGGPVSVNDIQAIVNSAIGPDGSRGIQHLSDEDLTMILSGSHGSTDTAMQAYHEAADQEYIKRSSLPPQN